MATRQFPSLYEEADSVNAPLPTFLHASNAVPSGPRPSFSYQPYGAGFYNTALNADLEPFGGTNASSSHPFVASLQPEYLTDPGHVSDFPSNGTNAAIPVASYMLPQGFHGYPTMNPRDVGYPTQPPFTTGYSESDNSRHIPIADLAGGQQDVPVGRMNLSLPVQQASSMWVYPTHLPNGRPGPIPSEHHSTWHGHVGRSESTDHAAHSPSSSLVQAFIDDNPTLNDIYHKAKEKVASYPIVKATTARRKNPAPFVCEICQQTFTRSHNLSYHKDAHEGLKKHSSLCGKKFGTPHSSKRHETTCPKCQVTSNSGTPSHG